MVLDFTLICQFLVIKLVEVFISKLINDGYIYYILFWMINDANIMSVLVQANFLNLLVGIRSSSFKINLLHGSDKYYRYH